MKIRTAVLIFVLSVSLLSASNLYAWDVTTPDGVTVVQTGQDYSYSAPGQNIIFNGNLSTNAGQTISIDAMNALLRSTTGMVTYANGNYFCTGGLIMVNTAGFVFGSTASVQAASIIVSTLNIDNSNFMNPGVDGYKFYRGGDSSFIYNAGRIAARPGGYVALLSQAINNSGTISVSSLNANIGKVVLAVGERMTVSLDDKSQISVVVDEKLQDTLKIIGPDGKVIDSAIKNSGTILAEGGKVILTAKILNKIFDYAVNNTGVIQATNLVNNNGVVELVTDGPSPVLNAGTIEASYIKVSVTGSDFINRGSFYAKSISGVAASGNADIKAGNLLLEVGKKISADNLMNIDVDAVLEVVFAPNGTAVAAAEADVTGAGEAISAPTVNITMRKLGTATTPVYIKATNLYIKRLDGNIDILESIGIGTSVLMRGPPEGFGSFIYLKDSNLTLDASRVELIGSAPLNFYGNITFHNFVCTVPDKEIYFQAGKTYTFKDSLTIDSVGGKYPYPVHLNSSEPGKVWYIKVDISDYVIRVVAVQDAYNISDFVLESHPGSNRGNNTNWILNTTYWVGAGNNNNWSTKENWYPAIVPGSADDIIFDGVNRGAGSGQDPNKDSKQDINNLTINSLTITAGYAGTITLSKNLTISGNFSQAGGTFDASGKAITINGNTAISGGIYKTGAGVNTFGDSAADTVSISGGELYIESGDASDIVINAGTWTNTGGTIVYKINANVNVISKMSPYYNLIINKNKTYTMAADIRVLGALNVKSGTLSTSTFTLRVDGSLTIDGGTLDAVNGNIDANGDVTISSGELKAPLTGKSFTIAGNWSKTGGTFTPGTGVVTFDGTSAQSISGSATTTFNSLIINNTSGVNMSRDLVVNGTLTLTNGTFSVGAKTLTLNGPAIAGTPANLSTTSFSNLVFGGSSTGVSIPSSIVALNNLTINNTNNVALNSNIALSGSLLGAGKLIITVTATGINKTYDGSTTATVNLSSYKIVGHVLTYNYSASFDDKNVGTGRTVNISGISLGGANSGSYVVALTTASTTANITARPITVTAAANTKVYDGLLTASGLPTITTGTLAAGDTGTWSQTYDNKNVGTTHLMTPSGTVADAGSVGMTGNYDITFTTIATGEITAKPLTVDGITAANKVYDGSVTATLDTTGATLSDIVSGDTVNLDKTGAIGTFDNVDVGIGKTVTISELLN